MARDKVQQARREAVKDYPITDLAEEYGMTVIKKRGSRGIYTTAEHDSINIYPDNTYHRYSTGQGGDPVAFMMEFSGVDEKISNRHKQVDECISILEKRLRLNPELAVKRVIEERKKPEFIMPPKADNDTRARAYLQKTRGISPEVVDRWIRDKMLYQENTSYGNCVFISYDSNGKPIYGVKRSTNPNFKFVVDVEGSDYSRGFFVRGKADEASRERNALAKENDQLFVTEAVIDLMSLQSLYQKYRDHELRASGLLGCEETAYWNRFVNANYYSLNGCRKYDGLLNTIAEHKDIKIIRLALDNDEAGRNAAEAIKKEIQERFKNRNLSVSISLPPTEGRDWNDELKAGYSFAAKTDALMDLEEKYGEGMNELLHKEEYLERLKYRMYNPRQIILPVNQKDYIDEFMDQIKFRTADTPLFSITESTDYPVAAKVTGLPVPEAEQILREMAEHIKDDDDIECSAVRFRIDYEMDGMKRCYQGEYVLKSSVNEDHGIISHIEKTNYKFINDPRFDKLPVQNQKALKFAYERLVPYLNKHAQIYSLEKQTHSLKERKDDGDLPDNVDPDIIPVYYDRVAEFSAGAKETLNYGYESEMKDVDTSQLEKLIALDSEPVNELSQKGLGFMEQAVYSNRRNRSRRGR